MVTGDGILTGYERGIISVRGRGEVPPLCETHDCIKNNPTWAQEHDVNTVCLQMVAFLHLTHNPNVLSNQGCSSVVKQVLICILCGIKMVLKALEFNSVNPAETT